METSTASTCPHIIQLTEASALAESPLAKYASVVSWNAYRSQTSRPTKRRKTAAPSCGTCGMALSRPVACLHCSFTGCWKDGHARQHSLSLSHPFCVEAKTGYVFCSGCDDFVYDAKLEELHLAAEVSAEEHITKFRVSQNPREPYRPWTPSEGDLLALQETATMPCQGRRGLLNLGQTCFLNVVLQCLLHNPLLRNYFLSDKHNSRGCKVENCSSCEMDKLFMEVYSDDSMPYGPVSFLATTWKASPELSGYAQQDAHEFFINTLDQIHSTSRGFTKTSCNCIMHSTFAGLLQSEVKCERCGNITTKDDPMLDISLELKTKSGEVNSPDNTLAACLRRYTLPEKLGQKEYSCVKCGKAAHEASKRLSIKKLPPVLSFQFKRFEHRNNDKSTARKIEASIRLPATLNMAPYTTLAQQSATVAAGSTTYMGPDALFEYDLFAVICHEGAIDNGHYTNFARFEDEWYLFNDDKVTHSTLGECLASSAYMCFYVKRHLDYKPNLPPSYVRARETEAAKEKELEREREREKEKEKESRELEEAKKAQDAAAREREVEDDLLAMV